VALAQRVTQYFRGSELQNYFHKMLEDKLKAIIKPQVHVCVWLCVCVAVSGCVCVLILYGGCARVDVATYCRHHSPR
jgi:hypothetical protein